MSLAALLEIEDRDLERRHRLRPADAGLVVECLDDGGDQPGRADAVRAHMHRRGRRRRGRPPRPSSARNIWCRNRRSGRPRCRAPRSACPAAAWRKRRHRASPRSRHRATSICRRWPASRRRSSKSTSASGHGEIEIVAVAEHFALAGVGQHDEFVGEIAADRAALRHHRDRLQAHAREGAQIGDEHPVIGVLGAVEIEVERIGVLHQEFAPAHQRRSAAAPRRGTSIAGDRD